MADYVLAATSVIPLEAGTEVHSLIPPVGYTLLILSVHGFLGEY